MSFPAFIGERFAVLVPDQSNGEPARLTLDLPQLISVKTSCKLRVSLTFSQACQVTIWLKFYLSG